MGLPCNATCRSLQVAVDGIPDPLGVPVLQPEPALTSECHVLRHRPGSLGPAAQGIAGVHRGRLLLRPAGEPLRAVRLPAAPAASQCGRNLPGQPGGFGSGVRLGLALLGTEHLEPIQVAFRSLPLPRRQWGHKGQFIRQHLPGGGHQPGPLLRAGVPHGQPEAAAAAAGPGHLRAHLGLGGPPECPYIRAPRGQSRPGTEHLRLRAAVPPRGLALHEDRGAECAGFPPTAGRDCLLQLPHPGLPARADGGQEDELRGPQRRQDHGADPHARGRLPGLLGPLPLLCLSGILVGGAGHPKLLLGEPHRPGPPVGQLLRFHQQLPESSDLCLCGPAFQDQGVGTL